MNNIFLYIITLIISIIFYNLYTLLTLPLAIILSKYKAEFILDLVETPILVILLILSYPHFGLSLSLGIMILPFLFYLQNCAFRTRTRQNEKMYFLHGVVGVLFSIVLVLITK